MMLKSFGQKRTRQTGGQEELRGVLGRGRDVPECTGTWLVGETPAGMGCCFRDQSIVLSDVEAYEAAHGNRTLEHFQE